MSRKAEEKLTFKTRIHELCVKDELRPIFECVYFKDGFMYASNGNAVMRQPLEWQQLTGKEHLNQKYLHKESYAQIMKFDTAAADDNGVACSNDNGQEVYFEFYENNDETINFVKYFNQHEKLEAKEERFIGLPTESLADIFRALHKPGGNVKMTLTGFNSPIIIEVVGLEGQKAIVMPAMLNESLF